MNFDLRLPLGLIFSLFGAILSLYGLFFTDPAHYAKSLGINVNLDWGLVIFAFGALMLFLAWRSRTKETPAA